MSDGKKGDPNAGELVVSPNKFAALQEGPGGHDESEEGTSEGTMVVPETLESLQHEGLIEGDKGGKASVMAHIEIDPEDQPPKNDLKIPTTRGRSRSKGPKVGPQLQAEKQDGVATPLFGEENGSNVNTDFTDPEFLALSARNITKRRGRSKGLKPNTDASPSTEPEEEVVKEIQFDQVEEINKKMNLNSFLYMNYTHLAIELSFGTQWLVFVHRGSRILLVGTSMLSWPHKRGKGENNPRIGR